MATAEIRLTVDPDTRKKNISISYQGDGGELPLEHEDAHKEIVDQLLEKGLLKAEEVGNITIEREKNQNPAEVKNEEDSQRESISQES